MDSSFSNSANQQIQQTISTTNYQIQYNSSYFHQYSNSPFPAHSNAFSATHTNIYSATAASSISTNATAVPYSTANLYNPKLSGSGSSIPTPNTFNTSINNMNATLDTNSTINANSSLNSTNNTSTSSTGRLAHPLTFNMKDYSDSYLNSNYMKWRITLIGP